MQTPKRNIDELVARYSLHSNFIDVFLEGPGDLTFMNWLYGSRDTVNFYCIENLDIKKASVEHSNFDYSNKGKIQYLVSELNRKVNERNYYGVVDRDFDFLGEGASDNLLLTDFSCVESYFFESNWVKEIFESLSGNGSVDIEQLCADFEAIIKELFILRVLNQKEQLNLSWVKIDTALTAVEGTIRFDQRKYLLSYLGTKAGMRKRLDSFLEKIEEIRGSLPNDKRFAVNGHDMTELIYFVAKKYGGVDSIKSSKTVLYLLRVIANKESLLDHSTLSFLENEFSKMK